jgi:hypothetical protein
MFDDGLYYKVQKCHQFGALNVLCAKVHFIITTHFVQMIPSPLSHQKQLCKLLLLKRPMHAIQCFL